MMADTPKPETSSEVLWMLFSLLTMEPARQIEVLGGIPRLATSDEHMLTENGAVYLLSTIETFYVSWLDEFEPCPAAQELFDLVWSMGEKQSYESFMDGEDWVRLRELAKRVLEEAGLEPWPVPQLVDFNDFIEIVRPEDMPVSPT